MNFLDVTLCLLIQRNHKLSGQLNRFSDELVRFLVLPYLSSWIIVDCTIACVQFRTVSTDGHKGAAGRVSAASEDSSEVAAQPLPPPGGVSVVTKHHGGVFTSTAVSAFGRTTVHSQCAPNGSSPVDETALEHEYGAKVLPTRVVTNLCGL